MAAIDALRCCYQREGLGVQPRRRARDGQFGRGADQPTEEREGEPMGLAMEPEQGHLSPGFLGQRVHCNQRAEAAAAIVSSLD